MTIGEGVGPGNEPLDFRSDRLYGQGITVATQTLHEGQMSRRNETMCWAANHLDEGNEFIEVSRTNARQADGFIEGGVEVVLDLDRVGPVCELTNNEAVDLAAALLAAVLAPLQNDVG